MTYLEQMSSERAEFLIGALRKTFDALVNDLGYDEGQVGEAFLIAACKIAHAGGINAKDFTALAHRTYEMTVEVEGVLATMAGGPLPNGAGDN